MLRGALLAIFMMATTPYILSAQVLPSKIKADIKKYKLNTKDVAIYIKETGKNRVVASLNIDRIMLPASVVKIYSAYAALLEFGYDYRWQTKFYYTGRLKRGVLDGDLIVKGFGDPTLETEDLPHIVSQLKAKGIKKIKGDIVIDRSYFTAPKRDSSHFDKNIYSAYNAMPDAFMFNQHLSEFTITPKGGRHHITKSIPGESYRIKNSIKSVSSSCIGSRSWPSIKVDHTTRIPTLIASGKLSKRCKKRKYTYIITKPYREFYAALKQEMGRAGIRFGGDLRLGKVPVGAKSLYTHYSKPLEEIISVTSKKSNNLFARHILLTLGAKVYGPPANLDKGRRAVMQILNRYRLLDRANCHIDNGCGLSRSSKITARSMARVLDHAYKNYGKRWMNTLSIAGTDGTIKRRFRNTSVKNRAWMKTGTLSNAKNIVGYLKSRSGKLYTVVILVNGKKAKWYGASLENSILKWLVDYKGSGVRGKPDPLQESIKLKDRVLWGDTVAKETKSSKGSLGVYYVQVGSFSAHPKRAFLEKLTNSGFAYRIIKDKNLFKTMVGPYADRLEANDALRVIRQDIPGAYITQL